LIGVYSLKVFQMVEPVTQNVENSCWSKASEFSGAITSKIRRKKPNPRVP
jgi:hypothetical protein